MTSRMPWLLHFVILSDLQIVKKSYCTRTKIGELTIVVGPTLSLPIQNELLTTHDRIPPRYIENEDTDRGSS